MKRIVLSLVAVLIVTGALTYRTLSPEVVLDAPLHERIDIPRSVLIKVPFTSQAPTGDWNDPFQEACEEAALLIAHHFYLQKDFTVDYATKRIRELTATVEELGYGQDITLRELADIAQRQFQYQPYLYENPSVDDLKSIIAQGYPIIVPAAGRKLNNPYFSGAGPWYHMLVLIGYTDSHFITHDPGTRRGAHYKYTHATILDAMHDWTGIKEDIEEGPKVVLVLRQNLEH